MAGPAFLVQKVAQLLASGRMAQLAQGLGLDLADAFARDVELLADLLERVRLAVGQTEAHPQHLLLARGQRGQNLLKLLAQQRVGRFLRRLRGLVVLNEVAQMAVLLLTDRRFEGNRLYSKSSPAHPAAMASAFCMSASMPHP